MLLPRPTTVPGFSTELQPTSTWSPRMAPNFFLPVSIRSAPVSYTHLKYPEEISALVGLDPATPDAYQNMDLSSVLRHLEHLGRPDWKRAILFQLVSHSLLRRCPASVRKDLVPAARRNFASIVWINEAKALPHSIRQIRQEGPPASVPTLFLLSNGKGTPLPKAVSYTHLFCSAGGQSPV